MLRLLAFILALTGTAIAGCDSEPTSEKWDSIHGDVAIGVFNFRFNTADKWQRSASDFRQESNKLLMGWVRAESAEPENRPQDVGPRFIAIQPTPADYHPIDQLTVTVKRHSQTYPLRQLALPGDTIYGYEHGLKSPSDTGKYVEVIIVRYPKNKRDIPESHIVWLKTYSLGSGGDKATQEAFALMYELLKAYRAGSA